MAANLKEMSEPPAQTEIKTLSGTPEALIYAPAGYIVTDTAGNLYVKGTDVTLKTGWKTATLT